MNFGFSECILWLFLIIVSKLILDQHYPDDGLLYLVVFTRCYSILTYTNGLSFFLWLLNITSWSLHGQLFFIFMHFFLLILSNLIMCVEFLESKKIRACVTNINIKHLYKYFILFFFMIINFIAIHRNYNLLNDNGLQCRLMLLSNQDIIPPMQYLPFTKLSSDPLIWLDGVGDAWFWNENFKIGMFGRAFQHLYSGALKLTERLYIN